MFHIVKGNTVRDRETGAAQLFPFIRTMQLSLALCIITAALSDALAPTRRRSALQKLSVSALGLTTAQRAAAATNAEAEKVRVASRELNELLKNEDALRFKVLVEGSGKLPIAVSFITFQPVSKSNFGRPTLVATSLDGVTELTA